MPPRIPDGSAAGSRRAARVDLRSVLASNPFVAAPMDGYSDYPFRAICRGCGAGLTFTEMIPAIALTFGAKDARRRVKVHHDDEPLAIQIEGSNPEVMARGAAMAQEAGAHFVDVNAGCPSRRVTNGGAGAALLSDLALMARILTAVRDAVTVPVTLKFRSGPSTGHLVIEEVARMATDCGFDGLTLHARTRSQGYRGKSDWTHIARLVEHVRLPVIGNGDVLQGDDGVRMLRTTGCAGVMVGRGAIGNPWLFGELVAAWKGLPPPPRPTRAAWLATVLDHYDRMTDYLGRDPELAARLFRKHLSRYARGMRGAVSLRRQLASVLNRPSLVAAIHGVLADEGPTDAMHMPMPEPDDAGFVMPEG